MSREYRRARRRAIPSPQDAGAPYLAQAGKQHFNPKSVFPFERVANSETPEPGFEKNPGLRNDLNTTAVDGWLAGADKDKPFFLVVADHSPHVVWPDKAEYKPEEMDIPPNHIDTLEYRRARVRYYTDVTKMEMNRTPQRSVRTARYKYILNLSPEITYTTHIDKATDHDGGREYWPSWEAQARTDARAAAIIKRYHERPREELYDIIADPHETKNLVSDPKLASVLAELRAQLAAWRKQQGDDKTGPEPMPSKK